MRGRLLWQKVQVYRGRASDLIMHIKFSGTLTVQKHLLKSFLK